MEDDPLPDPLIQLKLRLSEDTQQVILTLTALRDRHQACGQAGRSPGMDLVVALDVSLSMKGAKLYDVKTAMSFLLDTKEGLLTEKDRLAIITFSGEVKVLSGSILPMNENNRKDLLNKVRAISTKPYTNIWGALKKALELLQDRGNTGEYPAHRPAAIFLLSDGRQEMRNNNDVGRPSPQHLRCHPIYTFGFGEDHIAKVLSNIAKDSLGGTFNYVLPNMVDVFPRALAAIHSSLVRDLKLTVRLQDWQGHANKQQKVVDSQGYPADISNGSVTVKFGYLGREEVRNVLVDNAAADQNYIFICVRYEYKTWAPEATSGSIKLNWRYYEICMQTSTLPRMHDRAETETVRLLMFVSYLREATKMANERKFDNARSKLGAAMKLLEKMTEKGTMYHQLYEEGKNFQEIMTSEDRYNKGLSIILSVLSSHERQRPTATGDVTHSGRRMYETSTSISYVERANTFARELRARYGAR